MQCRAPYTCSSFPDACRSRGWGFRLHRHGYQLTCSSRYLNICCCCYIISLGIIHASIRIQEIKHSTLSWHVIACSRTSSTTRGYDVRRRPGRKPSVQRFTPSPFHMLSLVRIGHTVVHRCKCQHSVVLRLWLYINSHFKLLLRGFYIRTLIRLNGQVTT